MIRKFVNVICSNIAILLLGLIITVILPLKLTIEEFGYWQLYYFYSGFLGIFLFGFSDGINLKYSGKKYKELDKKVFKTYFITVCCISSIMCLICSIIVFFVINDTDRMFAFFATSLNIILFNTNGFFTHINQITLRFKYYSWGIVLERLIFVVSIVPIFFLPLQNFKVYIIMNIISRILVLIYNIITSKDIVFGQYYSIKECINEITDNIKVGIFLTISSITSMLLIGYTRVIVDKYMGITEFGIYSLANSILSIAVQIVIAISTVLYPVLRRIDDNEYESINSLLNKSVIIFGSVMLSTYFPISWIIKFYTPKYHPILEYLFCLFPILLYQCKNSIIIVTFYKILRLEKKMLINNLGGLIFSVCFTMYFFTIFGNLLSIVASSVLCYILWNYYNEWYLIKKFKWRYENRFLDLYIVSGFIFFSQISNWILGLTLYIIYLAVVGFIYRQSMYKWFKQISNIILAKKVVIN